jgi:Domain of unknown function (DUF1844)
MSSLWTPEGERPVRRESETPSGAAPGGPGGSREPTEEELNEQLARMQEQLANTPAEVVIANHAFGLFELAALHLSLQPPQLDQARLAIDALGALVEGLEGRLGEPEQQLKDGLAQLRLAYVQIKNSPPGPGQSANT